MGDQIIPAWDPTFISTLVIAEKGPESSDWAARRIRWQQVNQQQPYCSHHHHGPRRLDRLRRQLQQPLFQLRQEAATAQPTAEQAQARGTARYKPVEDHFQSPHVRDYSCTSLNPHK